MNILLLLYICVDLPYEVVFVDKKVNYVFIAIDVIFFIDLVLSFFTTFTHSETYAEVYDRK